jgi:hypothetical protein
MRTCHILTPEEALDIKNLPKKLVKYKHCQEDVQLGVLPFHERLCGEAQSSSHAGLPTWTDKFK